MKFTTAFAVLAVSAASVGAVPTTNGERLARGLPPMKPRTLYKTPARAAAPKPSNQPPPSTCSTGPVQCCSTVSKGSDSTIGSILGLLGIPVDLNALYGTGCTPLSVIGIGGSTCSSQTVCCENNSFGSLISIGCVPINISL